MYLAVGAELCLGCSDLMEATLPFAGIGFRRPTPDAKRVPRFGGQILRPQVASARGMILCTIAVGIAKIDESEGED